MLSARQNQNKKFKESYLNIFVQILVLHTMFRKALLKTP